MTAPTEACHEASSCRSFAVEYADAMRLVTASPPEYQVGLILFMRAVNSASTQQQKYDATIGVANCHFNLRNFHKTIHYCQAALNYRPRDPQATLLKGKAEHALGDLIRARASMMCAQIRAANEGASAQLTAVNEAITELSNDEWHIKAADVVSAKPLWSQSDHQFKVDAASLPESSGLCDFCLNRTPVCMCGPDAIDFRRKEKLIDYSKLSSKYSVVAEELKLAVRCILISLSLHSGHLRPVSYDVSSVVADLIDIEASVVDAALAFVQKYAIKLEFGTDGAVGFVISRDFSNQATHSCYPPSLLLINKDGLLAAMSSSDTVTYNELFDEALVALPRRRRHLLLRRRGRDGCHCDRCQDERDDFYIEAAICRACTEGTSVNLAGDEWTCRKCGTMSVRPTEWLVEWEARFERAAENGPLVERVRLTDLLQEIELKLASFHWLRFQILFRLVRLHLKTPSGDKDLANIYARKLLFLIDSNIQAYQLPNIRNYLVLDVISVSGFRASLVAYPDDVRLAFSIEEAIVPLMALLRILPKEAPAWKNVKSRLSKHATALLPMASAMLAASFSLPLRQAIVIKKICLLGVDNNVDEFLQCLDESRELLENSMDHMCIDTNLSILATLAEARKVQSLRALLEKFGANVTLADESGYCALFAACKSNKYDDGSLGTQVAQSACVKLLLKRTTQVRVQNARLNNELGGGSLLHEVGSARIARLLLDGGCRLDTLDILGRTPLMKARELGLSDLVDLFEEKLR